jgi:hypothetical protein
VKTVLDRFKNGQGSAHTARSAYMTIAEWPELSQAEADFWIAVESWVGRAAWLLVVVASTYDVAVTFGPHFGFN